MDEPVAIVMAGGSGTRLWPLSRDRSPKQFQPVSADVPLLVATLERLRSLFPPERIFVSTTTAFADAATACLDDVPASNLILEVGGKGSVAAFALAVASVRAEFGDVPIFVCPSDHIVDDGQEFLSGVAEMISTLTTFPDRVVVLGVRPTRADSSLGYFETSTENGVVEVLGFKEKPVANAVEDLWSAPGVYWNTACYATRASLAVSTYMRRRAFVSTAIERHLKMHPTEGYAGPSASGHELYPFFEEGVVPLLVHRDFGWNDVGTWARLETVMADQGVSSIGLSVRSLTTDVLSMSIDGRPIVTLGVSNLIIVSHDDAIYVLDKSMANDVAILGQLRSRVAEISEDLL